MPSSLIHGPTTFQRAMKVIFAAVQLQFSLVYLADVVISSMLLQDRIEQVPSILWLLYKGEGTLKLEKRKFSVGTILYFGYVLGLVVLNSHNRPPMRLRSLRNPLHRQNYVQSQVCLMSLSRSYRSLCVSPLVSAKSSRTTNRKLSHPGWKGYCVGNVRVG